MTIQQNKFIDISWSSMTDPNPKIKQFHVIGKTPIGKFIITWNGLSSHIFSVPWDKYYKHKYYNLQTYPTMHLAKEACNKLWENKLAELLIENCERDVNKDSVLEQSKLS